MSRAGRRVPSLRSRIALLLALGTAVAAILALLLARHEQSDTLDRWQRTALIDSAMDLAARFAADPPATTELLREDRIGGGRSSDADPAAGPGDPELAAALDRKRGSRRGSIVRPLPAGRCALADDRGIPAGPPPLAGLPRQVCWDVSLDDDAGVRRRFMIVLPQRDLPSPLRPNADFGLIILLVSLGLAIVTTRLVNAPLRTLSDAATSFSLSISPDPVPETGPHEVRIAIATFNLMQRRIADGLRQHTQMLAAINHDLRTPLTRLRLRLDQVDDAALRRTLVNDLAAMQHLVRDGLELARSSESQEAWVRVEIDSLLSSLAEDASELGAEVRFLGGGGGTVRTRPDALTRCLHNLVDNAIRYGGRRVQLQCRRAGGTLVISIRDHGPGIADEAIERMFEPFVRGGASDLQHPDGTGIGLSIARSLAKSFDASVDLSNHFEGGLVARVTIAGLR